MLPPRRYREEGDAAKERTAPVGERAPLARGGRRARALLVGRRVLPTGGGHRARTLLAAVGCG
uniref:Uncharacterized protein n=1 Tax=Oryza punctata TaxID=4537 RepID=A0A0E0KZW7_ORYPU